MIYTILKVLLKFVAIKVAEIETQTCQKSQTYRIVNIEAWIRC